MKYICACSCTHRRLHLSNAVRNGDCFRPQLNRSENNNAGFESITSTHTIPGFRIELTSPDMAIVIITKLSDILVQLLKNNLGTMKNIHCYQEKMNEKTGMYLSQQDLGARAPCHLGTLLGVRMRTQAN